MLIPEPPRSTRHQAAIIRHRPCPVKGASSPAWSTRCGFGQNRGGRSKFQSGRIKQVLAELSSLWRVGLLAEWGQTWGFWHKCARGSKETPWIPFRHMAGQSDVPARPLCHSFWRERTLISSCVEGRNGKVSLGHHALHHLATRKLQVPHSSMHASPTRLSCGALPVEARDRS